MADLGEVDKATLNLKLSDNLFSKSIVAKITLAAIIISVFLPWFFDKDGTSYNLFSLFRAGPSIELRQIIIYQPYLLFIAALGLIILKTLNDKKAPLSSILTLAFSFSALIFGCIIFKLMTESGELSFSIGALTFIVFSVVLTIDSLMKINWQLFSFLDYLSLIGLFIFFFLASFLIKTSNFFLSSIALTNVKFTYTSVLDPAYVVGTFALFFGAYMLFISFLYIYLRKNESAHNPIFYILVFVLFSSIGILYFYKELLPSFQSNISFGNAEQAMVSMALYYTYCLYLLLISMLFFQLVCIIIAIGINIKSSFRDFKVNSLSESQLS